MANAQQIICDALQCRLPPYRDDVDLGAMTQAAVEDGSLKATFASEPVMIEMAVTHLIVRDRLGTFIRLKLAALEIDLRPYRFADLSEEDWRHVVITEADRWWLYPPRQVRADNDRRRAAAIADMIARERTLEEAHTAAEREWKAHDRDLDRASEDEATSRITVRELRTTARAAKMRELDCANRLAEVIATRERAEAMRGDAERQIAFARWRRRQFTPPDLGRLVAAHRGYNRITTKAWAQWETDLAAYRQSLVDGVMYRP